MLISNWAWPREDPRMVSLGLSGVFAASLTPLDGDLEPDLATLLRHGRWLLDTGCDGLGILGTTGEANSLPVDARLAVIEATSAALPPERLLIGTGSCALGDAIRLTRAALLGGAVHALVLPPFYYKPLSDDGVFRFFAALIDAVADKRLRLFLYNFPQLTGYAFSQGLVARLLDRYDAVIAGMKDSSGQWDGMRDMTRAFPALRIFAGSEQFLLPILKEGGAGCISATANLTSAWCQTVFTAWRAGDTTAAEEAQRRLTPVRQAMQAVPSIPALKGIMARLTGRPGWAAVLPPFAPAEPADTAALVRSLNALGFVAPAARAA
jgi:4-hydroxy-tetrahydrodipicolinate synthase